MKHSESSYYAQISVAVVLLGVVGANSITERGSAAPADEHAVLVDNIGTYGRKISTKSPIAQKFFDQGLRLVYGYYFPEAIASFEEAQQYDPDHPMLDWGLALAMGPNPNSRKNSFPDDPHGDGRKAIASAHAHLARATPAERALIESLLVQYDTDRYSDRAVRDEKYIEATRSVLDRYPDDLEAGFMYVDSIMIRGAWNYWRRTAHRSLGRARRPLSSIISWRSIPIIPGQFTSMCISSRVLLSQNEPCRRQIGSNLCRRRATWSICLRTFIFVWDSTRKPSPAMSGLWQRIGTSCRNGEIGLFLQRARITFRPALTHRMRWTYCDMQRCSKEQLRAGTPGGARSRSFP